MKKTLQSLFVLFLAISLTIGSFSVLSAAEDESVPDIFTESEEILTDVQMEEQLTDVAEEPEETKEAEETEIGEEEKGPEETAAPEEVNEPEPEEESEETLAPEEVKEPEPEEEPDETLVPEEIYEPDETEEEPLETDPEEPGTEAPEVIEPAEPTETEEPAETEEPEETAEPEITEPASFVQPEETEPETEEEVTQEEDDESLELFAAKKEQTVTVKSKITKAYGAGTFNLGAKTSGDGTLMYKSSDNSIVTVNKYGKVTVKGVGTAVITTYAAESDNYAKSASKKTTIVVNPKKTSITGVINSAQNKAQVAWNPVSPATGYQIQYSVKSDYSMAKTVKAADGRTASRVIGSLTRGYKYYFRVRSYVHSDKDGKNYFSSWSKSKTVTISSGKKETFSKTPTISVKKSSNLKDTVSWNSLSGAKGYEISYRKGKTGTWKVAARTSKTSYKKKVAHGVYYYFRVRAYKRKADGSRVYGKYSEVKNLMQYFDPKYSVLCSDATLRGNCNAVVFNISNNGVGKIRIYSKNAAMIDDDLSSYNRNLKLIDADYFQQTNKIKTISYMDVPAGSSKNVAFIVDGEDTWYDSETTIYYNFRYDGNSYRGASSYTYGSTWSRLD